MESAILQAACENFLLQNFSSATGAFSLTAFTSSQA